MAGLLAGAMYGAGMAMQEVGMARLNNLLDEEKRTRLMQLEQQYADSRQDKQIAASERQIGLQGKETRDTQQAAYDRENADRRSIGDMVSRYAQGREETLPDDQAGPVGYVQPGGRSIAELGEREANLRGRPELAKQYRDGANSDMTDSEKLDMAARNARILKESPGSPDEVDRNRAVADHYRNEPSRQERIIDGQNRRADIADARARGATLMARGDGLMDNARDAKKKLAEDFVGGVPKEGAERARYMARMSEIEAMEKRGMSFIEEGAALSRGMGAPRGGASGQRANESRAPSPASIDYVKANPDKKADFERVYGAGSYEKYVGKAAANTPGKASPQRLGNDESRIMDAYLSDNAPTMSPFKPRGSSMQSLAEIEAQKRRSEAEAATRNYRGLLGMQ